MIVSAIKTIKSKTRASILKLFFNATEEEYYLRQIEKLTGYSAGNVRREIIKLESDGLFLSRFIGKIKLYKLNKKYPLYNEIKNIVRKTIGIESILKSALDRFEDMDFCFIYGSFAEGKENIMSDIDIIIIGNVKPKDIKTVLYDYQSEIKREINSIVYSRKEFLEKLKQKNHFVSALVKRKKIFLKGNEDEFRRFIQVRKTPKA